MLSGEGCPNRPFVLSLGTVVVWRTLGSARPHDWKHLETRGIRAEDRVVVQKCLRKGLVLRPRDKGAVMALSRGMGLPVLLVLVHLHTRPYYTNVALINIWNLGTYTYCFV